MSGNFRCAVMHTTVNLWEPRLHGISLTAAQIRTALRHQKPMKNTEPCNSYSKDSQFFRVKISKFRFCVLSLALAGEKDKGDG